MATGSKYFYPPRPGNGAGTFSDNIVKKPFMTYISPVFKPKKA